MLGCLADKALICGLVWSVSGCLSLCLESMAMGPCSQYMCAYKWTKTSPSIMSYRYMIKGLILVLEVPGYGFSKYNSYT